MLTPPGRGETGGSGMKPGTSMKIGLALGGGGAKGLAHIGVLRVLEEHGLVPDLLAGTSMGALVGALYSVMGDASEVEKFALGFEKTDLSRYLSLRVSSSGLVSDRRVRELLERTFGTANIEDLSRPFFATAVDILSGEEVIFSRGPLAEAVMASISIPVVFPPCALHGRYLADGGLVDLVPVDVLKRSGADFVIAVNVLGPPPRTPRGAGMRTLGRNPLLPRRLHALVSRRSGTSERQAAPNILEELLFAFEIMQVEMVASKLKNDAPDVVVQVETSDFAMFEFDRPREIIERGKQTMRRHVGEVERRIAERAGEGG